MDQSSLSYHNLKQDKELSIQDLLTKETKKINYIAIYTLKVWGDIDFSP